jgi:hypothetical protein
MPKSPTQERFGAGDSVVKGSERVYVLTQSPERKRRAAVASRRATRERQAAKRLEEMERARQ